MVNNGRFNEIIDKLHVIITDILKGASLEKEHKKRGLKRVLVKKQRIDRFFFMEKRRKMMLK
jgi:hypothetical protein